MVDEAEAELKAFEASTVGAPGNKLHSIAIACLDGDSRLRPDLRSALSPRDLNSFQQAVFSFTRAISFQSGPGKNQSHHDALRAIKQGIHAIESKLRSEGDITQRLANRNSRGHYVDASRITALRELQAPRLDPKRLIRLLEELNDASASDCHMATAMLVRAVLDHVPAVYGRESFAQVVANSPRSQKALMEHLENSLRKIADDHLHRPMRQAEDLPTFQQVDFRGALDQLLGDVAIKLRSS